MMIEIPDTPNKEPLSQECEHLAPIVKLLEENGNRVDRTSGVLHDKGEGNFLLFYDPIDLDLVTNKVNLPNFISASKGGYISCSRCWFNLEQRTKGKIFAGAKQIKW
ncbi:hypothetical protein MO867_21885 [Microbulbifer sp. OS29]|uniref:Uncharacterized protein n=1 Tax=Microbulbifer okhotskensis TaxID=2926617 RepID=A0A9X2ER95_9GAMM|nr:hypothetical protein [Microbulbifer okhotskensis]MCO1336979.1 hypothetical protein [Microbulbifer okhotskensis]